MQEDSNIDRLLSVMARLRDPQGGCPWDLEQTFATISPYTIEEAYEVADAIERGDREDLKDELGDLLLQVVFHARMAEEEGSFAFADVAGAIADKMIRRHPHVFGSSGSDIDSSDKVRRSWEETKADERADKGQDDSALSGVARALPALIRAEKLSKRAARVGFTWPDAQHVFRDLEEEVGELQEAMAEGGDPDRLEDEMGDILFVAANLARMLNVDPEKALQRTNRKFERRFRAIEAAVAAEGKRVEDVPLEELDRHWNAAKGVEKTPE